jgi:hypothetical protein
MPRIFAGGLTILFSSLVVALLISAAGNLKPGGESTSARTPAPASSKIADRAPAGDLGSKSARAVLARPKSKTGPGGWTVLPEIRQGGMWTHEGSIVRLEAIGRARRFFYVEVHGAFPAKNGDMAFEGVREGPTYSGQAFQFTANCEPLAYIVKGSVSTNESIVKLEGRKPRRDSQCHVVSYANEELVFSLKL